MYGMDLMASVSGFQHLESLYLDFPLEQDLPELKLFLLDLSCLDKLRSLTIKGCSMRGLDVLLQSVPLQSLDIEVVRLPKYTLNPSSTLQALKEGSTSFHVSQFFPIGLYPPGAQMKVLPALQLYEPGGFDLDDDLDDDLEDHERLTIVRERARAWASLPCMRACDRFGLSAGVEWDAELCLSMLKALGPLAPAFASTREIGRAHV